MAKGAVSKAKVLDVMKLIFPQMFSVDGKEYRIPLIEDGQEIELKVALTCAKDNIGGGGGSDSTGPVQYAEADLKITDEEKQEIFEIMKQWGL